MPPTSLRLALLSGLALAACGGGPGYEGPYRHVVLISLDTFRADHVGAYGAKRPTPTLDALAAEGVRFADVTAPAPTTLASHTSMMTGTWPHTHGVPRNGFVLDEANVTLAEVLSEAGFHTAAVLGSFALESRFDFDQGFAHFDEEFELLVTSGNDQNQKLAATVTSRALDHVDEVREREERLFLFLHYFDAHANYAPPAKYAEAMTGNASLTSTMDHVEAVVRARQAQMLGGPAPGHSGVIVNGLDGPYRRLVVTPTGAPTRDDRLLAALYAGEVAYIDDEIGRLLDGLRERQMLDETIVVVTGDHGETFWEHGDLWNHGLWVYQTTVHVPLLLRVPGDRFDARVVDTPVSTIDLVPTLCELLELETPPRVEGMSLVPFADGLPVVRGFVFSEATQPWKAKGTRWENDAKPQAVRRGDWKYVRSRYNEVEELFHLGRDPGERMNLIRADQALTDEARGHLEVLRAELDRWNAAADPLPSEFDTSQAEETREMLKGMGYAGEEEDEDEGK